MCPQAPWTWTEVVVLAIVVVSIFAPPLWVFSRVWGAFGSKHGPSSIWHHLIRSFVGAVAILAVAAISLLMVYYSMNIADPSLLKLIRCR